MLRDALIYLLAAVVFVPLAKRFGLGAVLGYLIAGAAIGPWGLKLIAEVETTLHFAEIGVVLMLFVIGLELEPKRLLSMKREVFGGGSLQILVCSVAFFAVLLLLGMGWKAALVLAFALALSSTAIAIATMTERNLMPTPTGRTAFAVLLFQDIAAIPLLAIIPFLGVVAVADAGNVTAPGWQKALIALGAIVAVIVVGRFMLRPLLRMIASINLREVFTAFTLLLVVGIAQLMSVAGLSMGLGAFLAGVLLASSEYRHALETDIEPFKGLLLGLFFISVGMSIDFGLLKTQPAIVLGLLGGFVVLKILTLWVVARVFGVSNKQRWLFALLIAQGSEFAFVVFTTARSAQVITREVEALATMVVALSMAASPLILLAYEKFLVGKATRIAKEADTIDETTEIIIAGFGRMGQIIGRILFANNLRATILDHDPEQIEQLRKFGYKVFYGDATRLDLLHAAGAHKAKLLINTIDDMDDNIALVKVAQENFPNLKIISRARNVRHYVELRKLGVEVVERETFESALRIGRAALESLGVDRYRAKELADIFRLHNIATTEKMMDAYTDEERLISAAKAGRREFDAQMQRDREIFDAKHGEKSW
jgi:glutathione-regulated potassium-efflux system ancillary protein KefC